MVSERIRRAGMAQPDIVKANSNEEKPGPMNATVNRESKSPGKAKAASMLRHTTISNTLPWLAAITPRNDPMDKQRIVTLKDNAIDKIEPCPRQAIKSRPKTSVPKGCWGVECSSLCASSSVVDDRPEMNMPISTMMKAQSM